jgi:hypothetical protein
MIEPRAVMTALGVLCCVTPRVAVGQSPDRFLGKVARFLASKGYANDPRVVPDVVRIIGSRVPAYVPGIATDGPRMIIGIQRKCPDSARATLPTCVRIDLIEAYTGPDTSLQGIIPLTFHGSPGAAFVEQSPSREVLGDAEYAARAVHTKVFRPAPLPLLTPAPEPDTLAPGSPTADD